MDLFDIDGTITGAITLGLSEPGSNSNEGLTLYIPDLQNYSLTNGCSLCPTQDKEACLT